MNQIQETGIVPLAPLCQIGVVTVHPNALHANQSQIQILPLSRKTAVNL